MKFKSKKGFTLLEILLVLSLVALLTTIAMPKVMGIYENAKLSKAKADAQIIVAAILREEMRYDLENIGEGDQWKTKLIEGEFNSAALEALHVSLNSSDYKFFYKTSPRSIEIKKGSDAYASATVIIPS